jgi:hypothetical protein
MLQARYARNRRSGPRQEVFELISVMVRGREAVQVRVGSGRLPCSRGGLSTRCGRWGWVAAACGVCYTGRDARGEGPA